MQKFGFLTPKIASESFAASKLSSCGIELLLEKHYDGLRGSKTWEMVPDCVSRSIWRKGIGVAAKVKSYRGETVEFIPLVEP